MRRTGLHSASKLSVSQSLVSEIRYRLTPDIKKIRNLKHICKHIILIVFGFYLLLYSSSFVMLIKLYTGTNSASHNRRCTLNRTYRERNLAVWCGTVQCTFYCSLLRRISPYGPTHDLGGLCPRPQPKTASASGLIAAHRSINLWTIVSRTIDVDNCGKCTSTVALLSRCAVGLCNLCCQASLVVSGCHGDRRDGNVIVFVLLRSQTLLFACLCGLWMRWIHALQHYMVLYFVFRVQRYTIAIINPSVCLSVCPSVCHTLVLCQNDSSYDYAVFTGG